MSKYYWLLLISTALFASCKKDWLNAPSDKRKVIPSTLYDLMALLRYESFVNDNMGFIEEAGSDSYYMTYTNWNSMSSKEKNLYIWNKDIFAGETSVEWNMRYRRVFIANVVLEGLDKIEQTPVNRDLWNQIKGTALFTRGYAFYHIAQAFAAPYNKAEDREEGIAVRLFSDFNILSRRASVHETYRQLLEDLNAAVVFLPEKVSFATLPDKCAAHAMLARVYLCMSNYEDALSHAGLSLGYKNELLDFNKLTLSATYPIARFNKEVVYHDRSSRPNWYNTARCLIDTTLYRSYHANDLRKQAFFRASGVNYIFKGGYDGTFYPFTGIAIDEVLLIHAECLARKGSKANAVADLNKLLTSRWKTMTYQPYTETDDVLALVINERRKELIFRNLRWTDLRRLNTEAAFATTLTRELNGTTYSLTALSPNYVLPLPDDVVVSTGMPQYIRN